MPPKQMLETIRQVHAGKKVAPPEIAAGLAEHISDESLSEREMEVLNHVAAGNRNRDIAERLFIAEETVKVHIKHIMSKLGASDRTQSVAIEARRSIMKRALPSRYSRRGALVFHKEHQEFGGLGRTGIARHGVDVLGRLVEGVAGSEGHELAASYLHHQ